MKGLLDKMKKLNENKNAKVVTFDFDNTIAKSYEESNDGKETIYQYGGYNPQIIARIKKFKHNFCALHLNTNILSLIIDHTNQND